MSALYKLNANPIYMSAMKAPNPHVAMAARLSKWLRKLADTLVERDRPFEAGDTEDMADTVDKFISTDATAEGFGLLWQELEQWGQTAVYSGGREKDLCAIPTLPRLLQE